VRIAVSVKHWDRGYCFIVDGDRALSDCGENRGAVYDTETLKAQGEWHRVSVCPHEPQWKTWLVEAGVNSCPVFIGSMEECISVSDALNALYPTDGIGYTANPVEESR